ncbi:MAG: nucleoside triphosphate pyrophosphohydrolase [Clostridia bacterium]|nr:nucleoside triphosphate pyrophosphohydrolase [Clostridia bacterium]MDQ7791867.1 nucleoside triphosphate pyrophosphohydrolase [Clostridia bacterium]
MGREITIVGLGPGAVEALPVGVVDALGQSGTKNILRTERHPVVPWLREQGIEFVCCDHYYEQGRDFAEVYREIADLVLEVSRWSPVVYAAPGHPLVAEEATRLILEGGPGKNRKIRIIPAMSFLDAMFATLRLDPAAGINIIDALQLDKQSPVRRIGNILMQVHGPLTAGDAKISLMEHYVDDQPVTVVRAAGVPGEERIAEVALYELDRLDWIDHLTSVYIPPAVDERPTYSLDPLAHIMAELRSEHGCPWDREQDHASLKKYLIEESYEVVEAVESLDMYSIREELGDLLLQIVFHAQIAREEGHFDLNDVIRGICEKMIHRHPHVFGSTRVKDAAEVLVNWERLKRDEKESGRSCLEGIPRSLPALQRADLIQSKVSRVGFDWPNYRGAMDKVFEELGELKEAFRTEDKERITDELGDLLFATVNLARLSGVDAEDALRHTMEKFCRRFTFIEEKIVLLDKKLGQVSLEEMDRWWEAAKNLKKT